MSASKNYDKDIYKHSELGKLEAKVRRFYNIEVLAKAFDKSPQGLEVRRLRKEAEEKYSKLADKQAEIEKKLLEQKKAGEKEIEDELKKYMQKEVDILTKFEINFK